MERNPVCGEWVRLELCLDGGGRIEAAYFNGGGCIISQAAASLLCEHIEGRTLPELASFLAKERFPALARPLPGSLPFHSMQSIE